MEGSVLVVGGSGGLGKEICKQERKLGHIVTSTWCNNIPSGAEGVMQHQLDLSNQGSISRFLDCLSDEEVLFKRVYFASAINGQGKIDDICTFESGQVPNKTPKYMQINCLSIIQIMHHLIYKNLLTCDAKIFALTSVAGSSSLRGLMVHNQSGGNLSYRLSKAALNCSVRNIAYDLESCGRQVIVCTVYPGWVKTTSSSHEAPNEPRDAVSRLLTVMKDITQRQNGLMLDLDGIPLPF